MLKGTGRVSDKSVSTKTDNTTSGIRELAGYITITTTEPDMITLDDDPTEQRALMPCGHAISTLVYI